MALRTQKGALAMLLQRGSVGDDLWQRFLRAEKEMEDEVRDVVAEVRPSPPFYLYPYILCGNCDILTGGNETGKRLRSRLGPNDLPICE